MPHNETFKPHSKTERKKVHFFPLFWNTLKVLSGQLSKQQIFDIQKNKNYK